MNFIKMQVRYFRWMLEEVGILITLALPPAIECMAEGLQIKLSNVFIGRVSASNVAAMLSALFIGQTFFSLTAFCIGEGFGAYVNVLCSQSFGAKQHKLVGLYFYRALFMSFLTCVPVFTIYISVRPIVYFLFRDHELAEYSGSYTDILCFGYPAYLYSKIGIRFLQALNIVWGPALYLIIGLILNGIVQYILIFQYNTGIQGAAAGYVISNYLVALLVFSHIQLSRIHTTMSHEWSLQFISDWYHTSRYAVVNITQFELAIVPSAFFPMIFIGIVEQDKTQLAIFSIIFSAWWVFTLGSMGLSSAITVRVGNLLGDNRAKAAKKVVIFDLIFAQIVLAFSGLLLLAVSEPLSHLFTTDSSFAKEISWNLMIFSFFINTEIKFVIQGVINACCKQGIQTVFKFIFQIVLGVIMTGLLVHFVEWKALSIILQFGISNIATSAVSLIILFRSNWEDISHLVATSTNKSHNYQNFPKNSSLHKTKTVLSSSNILILLRYITCVVVSLFVLVYIFFQKSY